MTVYWRRALGWRVRRGLGVGSCSSVVASRARGSSRRVRPASGRNAAARPARARVVSLITAGGCLAPYIFVVTSLPERCIWKPDQRQRPAPTSCTAFYDVSLTCHTLTARVWGLYPGAVPAAFHCVLRPLRAANPNCSHAACEFTPRSSCALRRQSGIGGATKCSRRRFSGICAGGFDDEPPGQYEHWRQGQRGTDREARAWRTLWR